MPVSGDGILEATFDPAWAAVRLIVDGGMWPTERTNRVKAPRGDSTWTGSFGGGTATEAAQTTGGPAECEVWDQFTFTVAPTSTTLALYSSNVATAAEPVTPGETVTASIRGIASKAVTLCAAIYWYDGTGAYLTTTLGASVTATPGAWSDRLSVTAVAPAGAAYGRVAVYIVQTVGTLAIGDNLGATAAMLESGAAVGPYFDGGTADTATTTYAWTGAENASTSTADIVAVDTITITRSVPGEADIPVRGLESRFVVGGTFVGTDHEAPLESSVTYRVDGYLGSTFVASATVTESTSGAEWGPWLKVPGLPDATVLVEATGAGDVESETTGGVYRIAGGGGSVSQSVAQWSGVDADTTSLTVEAWDEAAVARLGALLTHRVLLVQTGTPELIPSGYYFVPKVSSALLSPLVSPARSFTLALTRTGRPAGQGVGIAGNTWATLADTNATWADVLTAYATWFDVLKGA